MHSTINDVAKNRTLLDETVLIFSFSQPGLSTLGPHPSVIIAVWAQTSKDECHGVSDYNVEKCSISIQFLSTSHRKQKAILNGLLVLQEPMNTISILNGLNIATLHCKITSTGF